MPLLSPFIVLGSLLEPETNQLVRSNAIGFTS